MSFNRLILLIFALALILIGILGFVLAPELTPTSDAAPYNIFHIVAGCVGLMIVMTRREWPAIVFNLGLGAFDIYQFVASHADWFPEQFFQWTRTDDILHITIGIILALLGLYGFMTNRPIPVRHV